MANFRMKIRRSIIEHASSCLNHRPDWIHERGGAVTDEAGPIANSTSIPPSVDSSGLGCACRPDNLPRAGFARRVRMGTSHET